MKIAVFYCILISVTLNGNYSFSQTDNQKKILCECYNLYQQGKENKDIVAYLNENSKSLKKDELYSIYDSLVLTAHKKADFDASFDFTIGKIENGYVHIMVLEDSIASFFRSHHPDKYQSLEQAVNKKFVEKSLKFFPNINLELAFTIRHLFRLDQRTKLPSFNQNDKKTLDSLRLLSMQQDSITEYVLGSIFENYGYPGLSLIGEESSSVYVLMLHLGTEFQIKYVHLVQEAILKKQLYSDLNFLVDKILHKCCNKTIYGTMWSRYSPVTSDPNEVKKLKDLLKIL